MRKKISESLNNLLSSAPLLLILLLVATFLLGATTTKLFSLQEREKAKPEVPQQPLPSQKSSAEKVNLEVGSLSILGNKDAKVTVIEFADFQCPFCERWFKEVEVNLTKDYVKTGKVKFAFRNYAFLGDESTWAAEAAYCANEQNKFWEFHDYLYNHQGAERSGTFAKAKLEGFADQLGLNTNKFNSCLETDKYAKNVADDLAAGQKAGVQGTPATFINGQIIVGAQPYSTFKAAIDQTLTGK